MNKTAGWYGASGTSFERAIAAEVAVAMRNDPDGWAHDFGDIIDQDHKRRGDRSFVEIIRSAQAWVSAKTGPGCRVVGIRDQLFDGHPSEVRMARFGCSPSSFPTRSQQGAALPSSSPDIREATVARWGPLSAPGCERILLYLGNKQFDVDWSSDDLMLQTLFVSLSEFVEILQQFFVIDPMLFQSAWERDIAKLVRLFEQHADAIQRCVQIDSKRLRRLGSHFKVLARKTLDRNHAALRLSDEVVGILVLVCQFFELERGFELIEAVTGPDAITEVTLAAALATQADMNAAILSGSRLGEFLAGSMLHYLPLVQGAASKGRGHAPESIHVALARGGTPGLLDIVVGSLSMAAYEAVCREQSSLWSKTVGLKDGLATAGFTAPGHFLNGMEPVRLIFSFLLMMNQRLPAMSGRSAPSKRPAGFHQDSSFGRLTLLILANIDPALAQSILNKSIATQSERECLHWPPPLDGLVCNPNLGASANLTKGHRQSSAQEELSSSFGGNVCVENVKKARLKLNEFISSDMGKPSASQGFYGDAWLHEAAFEATLETSIDPAQSNIVTGVTRSMPPRLRKFTKTAWRRLVRIANTIHAGKTPMAEDPARRLVEYHAAKYGAFASFAINGIRPSTSPFAYQVADEARRGVNAKSPVGQSLKDIKRKQLKQEKRLAARGYV